MWSIYIFKLCIYFWYVCVCVCNCHKMSNGYSCFLCKHFIWILHALNRLSTCVDMPVHSDIQSLVRQNIMCYWFNVIPSNHYIKKDFYIAFNVKQKIRCLCVFNTSVSKTCFWVTYCLLCICCERQSALTHLRKSAKINTVIRKQ